jgi:hypothetical protein
MDAEACGIRYVTGVAWPVFEVLVAVECGGGVWRWSVAVICWELVWVVGRLVRPGTAMAEGGWRLPTPHLEQERARPPSRERVTENVRRCEAWSVGYFAYC